MPIDTQPKTNKEAPSKETILEFSNVAVQPARRRRSFLQYVDLRIAAGELALIRVERGIPCPTLADVAQGLDPPDAGTVRFEGEAWDERNPRQMAMRRARIGRVFEQWGWVSNLDVVENIVLSSAHHDAGQSPDALDRAKRLGKRVGLEALPPGRPAFVPVGELQRAQWVRAVLRSPRLLLLERPMQGVRERALPQLCELIDESRRRDTAVLWLTSSDAVWDRLAEARDTTRYTVQNERLHPETSSA